MQPKAPSLFKVCSVMSFAVLVFRLCSAPFCEQH